MIIIINGVAKSGKDVFIKYCQDICMFPVYNISYIDSTKEIAKNNFDWDGKKDERGRKLLSDIEDIRIKYNNSPYKDIFLKIIDISLNNFGRNLIFIHCRKPTEIKKLEDYYEDKCITLLINRSDIEIPNNKADQSVYDYDYDMMIENNETLEELKESAKTFIKDIFKGE